MTGRAPSNIRAEKLISFISYCSEEFAFTQNYDQRQSRWVSKSKKSSKLLWACCCEPLGVSVVVDVKDRVGDYVEVEVDQVNDGMDQRKQGEDHGASFVVAHVVVQWYKLVDTKPPKRKAKVKP